MEYRPPLNLDPTKDAAMCFGCGEANPIGLKLKFTWDEKTLTASANFKPEPRLQGWSGYVHGGIIACVLDEATGWAANFAGANNVTAKLQVRYRKMVSIDQSYTISCKVTKQASKLIETEAKLIGQEGTVMAEAVSTQFILNLKGGNRNENE